MKNRFLRALLPLFLLSFFPLSPAGAAVADKVVAVVGGDVIFRSELDSRETMTRLQYPDLKDDRSLRSSILDGLINQKIILQKPGLTASASAKTILPLQPMPVLRQLSRRFSSKEDMERQFGKSIEASGAIWPARFEASR